MALSQAAENVYRRNRITEKSISDGTGNFTVAREYLSGTLEVNIDGTITDPAFLNETGAKTYSVTPAPRNGSKIITVYNPK